MVSFEQSYPHITSWVQDGCLEIGSISYDDDSFIRATDEGGTAWESAEQFETLDDALAAASLTPTGTGWYSVVFWCNSGECASDDFEVGKTGVTSAG